MGEFKFRVWDILNKMFLPDYDFCIHKSKVVKIFLGFEEEFTYKYLDSEFGEVDGFIIQKYTGFKDINCQDIYEGDIVKFGDLNYSVFWNDWKWNATCPNYCKYHWPQFGEEFCCKIKNSEVIGNICQNEELIK